MITKHTVNTHGTFTRGDLSVVELNKSLVPFEVKRVFWITNMAQLARRGGHAHRAGEQFMFCPTGSVQIRWAAPKGEGGNLILTGAENAIHVPPLHWLDIRNVHQKTVLVVLASNPYEEADYIRDEAEFKRLCA